MGYRVNTVTKYVNLPGWHDLFAWCKEQQAAALVEAWMDGEEAREIEGLELAFDGLFKLMRGEAVGPGQKTPSPAVTLGAIVAFGEFIGYTQTKELIAQKRAEALLADAELDEMDGDALEINEHIPGTAGA